MNNNAPAVAELKSKRYREQAVNLLRNEYPRISCQAIKLVMEYHNFDLTASYNVLSMITADNTVALELIFQNQSRPPPTIFIRKERKATPFLITNPNLKDEIGKIPALNKKKSVKDAAGTATKKDEIIELLDDSDDDEPVTRKKAPPPAVAEVIELLDDDSDNEEKVNNKEFGKLQAYHHENEENTAEKKEVECGCCFGEYSVDEMGECSVDKEHRCCWGCIRRYVEEQLDGNNRTNFCCIVDSDCDGVYSISKLDTFLSPNINRRINARNFRSQIELSGMSSWACNKCSHIGFLEEPYPPTVFCDDCQIEYCRECKQPMLPHHQGKTCEQLRAAKDPVIRAQEAMSKATIRVCPDCSTQFQKHDGCNKMTCSKCKCLSCYLCRSKIKGYIHFCNIKDCRCNRCHLWQNPDEADRLARQEAGRKVLVEANMNVEEIENILASPPPKLAEGNHPAVAKQRPEAQPANQQADLRGAQPRLPIPRRLLDPPHQNPPQFLPAQQLPPLPQGRPQGNPFAAQVLPPNRRQDPAPNLLQAHQQVQRLDQRQGMHPFAVPVNRGQRLDRAMGINPFANQPRPPQQWQHPGQPLVVQRGAELHVQQNGPYMVEYEAPNRQRGQLPIEGQIRHIQHAGWQDLGQGAAWQNLGQPAAWQNLGQPAAWQNQGQDPNQGWQF